MYNNINIWSNGHSYENLNEYGSALKNSVIDFKTDSLNVFINTCVPLISCSDRFKDHDCISVHCGVPKRTTVHCLFGFDEMKKYQDYIKQSYAVYTHPYKGGRCVTKLPSSGKFDIDNKSNDVFCWLDESEYKCRYPKDKPNQTTGFLTFIFMRQIYPSARINLVNFGVNDVRFNKTKKEHSIEFEQQIFDELDINRIYV